MSDRRTPPPYQRPWEALPEEALSAWTPHHPALVDEIIEAIRAEVPAYARPLEGAFGQAVRRGVGEALAQFDQMARNPGVGRASGRSVYVALGRGEVRAGRSLDALLAAYRVGARVAWRRLASAGLAAGLAPETLVLLAESIFAYIDELSAESAEGFAQEQAERAGEADRRRAAVLELLLRTPPATDEALAEAASALDWPVPRELSIVVWPAEGGRRPVARLPVDSIAAPMDGLMCAVVPDPAAPGRRGELELALAGIAAGMGPAVPRSDAPRSYARAMAALHLADEGSDGGVVVADEHRIELLWRADPSLVAEIRADRLRPLEQETELSRRRLAATLLSWLRQEGKVTAAAEELEVHPQTVRYRMGRLHELFGDCLDDPDARFELEVALRAQPGLGWRWTPGLDHSNGDGAP
ncbi:MAG: PucR family transcriptional regulator [Solirubrobacteraceae bacterium]